VVCAPSNEAADGICERISGLNKQYDLRRSVLRVLARSREQQCRMAPPPEGNDEKSGLKVMYLFIFDLFCTGIKYSYLHEEVQKSPDWLAKEGIVSIFAST
jgi:hypothetical protein